MESRDRDNEEEAMGPMKDAEIEGDEPRTRRARDGGKSGRRANEVKGRFSV